MSEQKNPPTGILSNLVSRVADKVEDAAEHVVDSVRDRVEGVTDALSERRADSSSDGSDYAYAHSFTYSDGKVAEPIAILRVDDANPFPEDQGLNFVQIAEIAEVAVELLANLIVKLTNLLNFGAVDSGASESADLSTSERSELGSLIEGLILSRAGLSASSSDAHREHRNGKRKSAEASTTLLQKILDAFTFLVTDVLKLILRLAGLYGTAVRIEQFAGLFQTVVVPDVLSTWQSDHAFARLRVAGPNPNSIRRVIDALPAHFEVTDSGYQRVMGDGDSIAQAIADRRLYYTDYRALSAQQAGAAGGLQKHVSVPMVLFAVPAGGGALVPVAIQLAQEPSTRNPVFYPFNTETWPLAKLHAQVADSNYHELVSHLGLTHLLVEPFVVSTHRKLPAAHPLSILLQPHFQGTLFINNAAFKALINPGGAIDQLLSGTIESDWAVSFDAVAELDFTAWMLPNDLAARGVADPSLPLEFPYRDDAMLLWSAIEQWVTDYLALYYSDDAAVAADAAVQAWVQDLTADDGGRIRGLGVVRDGVAGIDTFRGLVDAATMIIFTASAQHAAVNFPQRTIMSYTPAMPLAAYQPAPVRTAGVNPGQGVLPTLPPLQRATLGQLVLLALGGVYFTRLGDYDRHQRGSYFEDPQVAGALNAFQASLARIERTIGERNNTRESYTPLLPSRIPQSINI